MSTTNPLFVPSLWADKIEQTLKTRLDGSILRNLVYVSWAERVPDDEELAPSLTFLTMQACMFGDLS